MANKGAFSANIFFSYQQESNFFFLNIIPFNGEYLSVDYSPRATGLYLHGFYLVRLTGCFYTCSGSDGGGALIRETPRAALIKVLLCPVLVSPCFKWWWGHMN